MTLSLPSLKNPWARAGALAAAFATSGCATKVIQSEPRVNDNCTITQVTEIKEGTAVQVLENYLGFDPNCGDQRIEEARIDAALQIAKIRAEINRDGRSDRRFNARILGVLDQYSSEETQIRVSHFLSDDATLQDLVRPLVRGYTEVAQDPADPKRQGWAAGKLLDLHRGLVFPNLSEFVAPIVVAELVQMGTSLDQIEATATIDIPTCVSVNEVTFSCQ